MTKLLLPWLFAVLATLASPAPSSVAEQVRRVEVRFAAGAQSASYQESVRGYDTVEFRLAARAGQTMSVRLRSQNTSANFNVMAPGSDTAIFMGMTQGSEFSGTLPATGTYVVQVFLVRAAARRGEQARFSIDFRIEAGAARSESPPARPQAGGAMPPAPRPDFADGFDGGPDFWAVTGVPSGDALNLRAGPSVREATLLQLAEGAVVRNLGCRPIDGARWCRVQLRGDADAIGWVNGRYLREAAAPAPQSDASVGDTAYHATGSLPCRVRSETDASCRFGVKRAGPGKADVDVWSPDGLKRSLRFSDGQVRTDGGEARITRQGDATIVEIGDAERFVVPDAVVNGG